MVERYFTMDAPATLTTQIPRQVQMVAGVTVPASRAVSITMMAGIFSASNSAITTPQTMDRWNFRLFSGPQKLKNFLKISSMDISSFHGIFDRYMGLPHITV